VPLVAALSDCGYVTVPEHHRQPNNRTIQLAVVRTRSIGDDPTPDPLIMEQGGPGGSTIGLFPSKIVPFTNVGTAILQQRDMVFVEQRGTQFSRPALTCPERVDHNVAVAKGELEFTDPSWITACRERLAATGVNFSAFNSIENAADLYFVAEVLGYEQFNFYGASYGTLLGQYVMAQADKHPVKLRSLILDGVIRPDVDFNLGSSYSISQALRNVFTACAQDAQCNQTYPNLEKVFLSLVDRLNQQPIPAKLTIPNTQETFDVLLDGKDLAYAIVPYLYSTEDSRFLPRNLYRAKQNNDFAWAEEKLSAGLAEDGATGMYSAVLCARVASVTVDPATLFPAPYSQLAFFGSQEKALVDRACDALQPELEPPFTYENTEVPTLVFNGQFDPVTPEVYGKAVASNLKTPYVYTFPGVGHVSLVAKANTTGAACSQAIALDFLSNPNRPPDSRCLAEVKPVFDYELMTPKK
jgi:pimeloyl-ACP methyl ester carboxylesterase